MTRRSLTVLLAVAIPGIAILLWWLADPAPADGLEKARHALADARAARAEEYAPAEFRAAQRAWDEALEMIRSENTSIAPLRSYDSVRAQIVRVIGLSGEARHRAERVRDSLRTRLRFLDRVARRQLDALDRAAGFYPAAFVSRESLHRARLLASRSRAAADDGQLRQAVRLAERQLESMDSAALDLQAALRQVTQRVEGWSDARRRLVRARRYPFVVVDKAARRLYLHQASRIDSFTVEFGRNWLGPKRIEGDGATPEGLYHVTRRLDGRNTRYHRALLLDYPNADDRARFDADRRAGRLPGGARIGGLIEIHGGGGRSVDWTDGCVALRNRDVERLFASVPVGTPVLIAGSLSERLPHVDTLTEP